MYCITAMTFLFLLAILETFILLCVLINSVINSLFAMYLALGLYCFYVLDFNGRQQPREVCR